VLERQPVIRSVLSVNGPGSGGSIAYESYARTDLRSVRMNQNHLYWKSSAFVLRRLEELHRGQPPSVAAGSAEAPIAPSRVPGTRDMLRFGGRMLLSAVRSRVRQRRFSEQWGLGLSTSPTASLPELDTRAFSYALPGPDRYWADPFPVLHRGNRFVFFEEFVESRNRGHIAVAEVDARGAIDRVTPVLEREYHLSYPCVFEWRGDHYMVPESSQARSIQLLRATRFPFEWEPVAVLLDGVRAVDATLVEVDGRWWMFANISPAGTVNYDELYLFSAPAPAGPWTPHPANPVKSDARSARPAGRLCRVSGGLVRPAQDCSGGYGRGGVVLNRVVRLDSHEYREIAGRRLSAGWMDGVIGVHTLNSCPGLTAIDVLFERPRGDAQTRSL
jgi:hypothetical protein